MWTGSWNRAKTVFEGSYRFADGTVFSGEAKKLSVQRITHLFPDRDPEEVEMPVAEHFEYSGTWEKDGMAGSPMEPPESPPEEMLG